METLTLTQYLIGIDNMALYQAMWVFAFIGMGLRWTLSVQKRDKTSIDTPDKFSLKFFLFDNSKRIFTSVLLTFIFLRFPDYLLQNIPVISTNTELRLLAAFGVGLMGDKLAMILKKWNFLGLNNSPIRDKIKQQNEENLPPSGPVDPADN